MISTSQLIFLVSYIRPFCWPPPMQVHFCQDSVCLLLDVSHPTCSRSHNCSVFSAALAGNKLPQTRLLREKARLEQVPWLPDELCGRN